jgi:hypothetical protein
MHTVEPPAGSSFADLAAYWAKRRDAARGTKDWPHAREKAATYARLASPAPSSRVVAELCAFAMRRSA